jgi:hypothetical protein
MLFLLIAMFLTDSQQAAHDAVELAMYNKLQADQSAIADIWRPTHKLLSDYRAARRCYVQFHLYKAEGCGAELAVVDRDLAGKANK